MFGVVPREKHTFHAGKLRGDGTVVRRCIWLANIGPQSKLPWCQNHKPDSFLAE
jgi:hypothetical protein